MNKDWEELKKLLLEIEPKTPVLYISKEGAKQLEDAIKDEAKSRGIFYQIHDPKTTTLDIDRSPLTIKKLREMMDSIFIK